MTQIERSFERFQWDFDYHGPTGHDGSPRRLALHMQATSSSISFDSSSHDEQNISGGAYTMSSITVAQANEYMLARCDNETDTSDTLSNFEFNGVSMGPDCFRSF